MCVDCVRVYRAFGQIRNPSFATEDLAGDRSLVGRLVKRESRLLALLTLLLGPSAGQALEWETEARAARAAGKEEETCEEELEEEAMAADDAEGAAVIRNSLRSSIGDVLVVFLGLEDGEQADVPEENGGDGNGQGPENSYYSTAFRTLTN